MADEREEDRTEPATPRKREEARSRGHVARSADLSAAVVLLAAVLALELFGGGFVGGLAGGLRDVLGRLAEFQGDGDTLLPQFGGAFAAAFGGFWPLILVLVAAALVVGLAQVGFLFTGEPLKPDLERLDPVAGFGRMVSLRAALRGAGGVLKLAAVAVVAAWTLWGERARLLELGARPFEEILGTSAALSLALAWRMAIALALLGALDYGWQRWRHEQDLRMSKREIREELRRYEGDPRTKERRRALQRRLALGRMMDEVPAATVVVTNPTHLAVALRYEPKEMHAPKVVAKGAEHLAERIRELAGEHGVPVVERKDLARALYRNVDVGQTVPAELYQAVAEILAYAYRLKGTAPTAA